MSRRAAALLALGLAAGGAGAQEGTPTIRQIAFAGNEVTQPEVMLREIVIRPGDSADPGAIERSRQAIQDLGLFRSVDVRQTAAADGGVLVTFVVEEKWYILPIPRFDANSEGESAYGLSLRWYNIAGLNHTLRGSWARSDEAQLNKGESTSYSLGYSVPFVGGTPYGLGFAVGHSEAPITDFNGYIESFDSAAVSLNRSFGKGPASQGWNTGLSLGWKRQKTEGPPGTPAPYGRTTSLGISAGYRDVRFNLYSEDGVAYGLRAVGATEGLGSDYSYGAIGGDYIRYFVVGTRTHQNLNVFASAASYHGGPTEYTTQEGNYSLGGASVLRAYPGDFVRGDFFYHVGAEYLRPVVADWLRALIVIEAGNAFEDASAIHDRVYASIGVGLRLRLTFLVNVEVEAGLAWPLDGGDQRFFASRV